MQNCAAQVGIVLLKRFHEFPSTIGNAQIDEIMGGVNGFTTAFRLCKHIAKSSNCIVTTLVECFHDAIVTNDFNLLVQVCEDSSELLILNGDGTLPCLSQ